MSWRIGSNLPFGMVAAAGVLLAAGLAHAQSVQSQKLEVSAVIGDLCTVSTASLEFGSAYDGSEGVPATGSIDIDCIAQTNLGVALDGGKDGNGGGLRRMDNGLGASLDYQLFTDQVGGDPWETNEQVSATITGSGSVPVHGMILVGQGGLASGFYSDEVTITLHF